MVKRRPNLNPDDFEHIRMGIQEIKTMLAVHDAKAGQYVERIAQSQERVAESVEKVADATVKIGILVEKISNNGNGRDFILDRKTMARLIGLAIAGAIALGSGNEIVRRVFSAVAGPPAVVVEPMQQGPGRR